MYVGQADDFEVYLGLGNTPDSKKEESVIIRFDRHQMGVVECLSKVKAKELAEKILALTSDVEESEFKDWM